MGDSGTHLDEFLVSERGGLTPGLGISVGFTAFEIFGVLAGTGDAGTADSAKEGLSLGGGAAVVEVARLGEIGIVEDGAEFSKPADRAAGGALREALALREHGDGLVEVDALPRLFRCALNETAFGHGCCSRARRFFSSRARLQKKDVRPFLAWCCQVTLAQSWHQRERNTIRTPLRTLS